MFENAPNGFFVRNLIIFNLLRRGGYVAKGFVFEAPDLTNSQISDLSDRLKIQNGWNEGEDWRSLAGGKTENSAMIG